MQSITLKGREKENNSYFKLVIICTPFLGNTRNDSFPKFFKFIFPNRFGLGINLERCF